MVFITVIVFILIFSLLILIHEFGHFYAAKSSGVKVEEFGFGLPPRLFGIKKGETIYSINWIPFGGFVRMLGEDTAKGKKSKRSINNQPLRIQAWVVCAGVVMNLLLAFLLLTFGFLVGIEPLIVDSDDFAKAVREGVVDVQPGIVVVESNEPYKTVKYDGKDLDIRSFEPGDRLLTIEGEAILSVEQWEESVATIKESKETLFVEMDRADGTGGAEYLDATHLEQVTFAPLYLNRFAYLENPDSILDPYLEDGDFLLKVDDEIILAEEDLFAALDTNSEVDLEIYRPELGLVQIEDVSFPSSYPVIAYVYPDSVAEAHDIRKGDQIVSMNSEVMNTAEEVVEYTNAVHDDRILAVIQYDIVRDGQKLTKDVSLGEEGLIGVLLSDQVAYYGNLSLYDSYLPHTLVKVNSVSYGPVYAPVVAVQEMWRLGKLTAVMFMNVLGQFISGGAVPAGVAGPVGIAQMTFVTIQNGFASMLRFVALLSLSLGVINILPLPALDGGRLVFILFQALTGRRPSPKFEGFIHNTGFVLLILFLLYVTFNDVLSLF